MTDNKTIEIDGEQWEEIAAKVDSIRMGVPEVVANVTRPEDYKLFRRKSYSQWMPELKCGDVVLGERFFHLVLEALPDVVGLKPLSLGGYGSSDSNEIREVWRDGKLLWKREGK